MVFFKLIHRRAHGIFLAPSVTTHKKACTLLTHPDFTRNIKLGRIISGRQVSNKSECSLWGS